MNWSFLRQDVKRSFCNMGFAAGFLGLFALMCYNFVTESMTEEGFYYAIVNLLAASGFTVFLPVFPVLGYASAFCGEYKSGYYRFILSRMSFRDYARVRIASVALSGGAIVAVPYLLCCLAALSLGVPEISESSLTLRVDVTTKMMGIAQRYGPGAVVAAKVLLGFLFGAAWALVGLAFAVWIPNWYVSLIAPFVLYGSLSVLFGYSGPRILAPQFLVRGDDFGHLLSAAFECVWLAAAAAAAMAGFRRRCRNA